MKQNLARADYGGYAEFPRADRHVRVRAAVLRDEPTDVPRENPIEAGIGAGHKKNSARESIRRIGD